MKPAAIFLASLCLASLSAANGIAGYDCGGESLNITSLSLTDLAECNVENLEPKTEEVYLQLLQLNEVEHVQVIQCRIEIDRTIFYCGMHSHISAVKNGKHEYIREVSAETCQNLHNTGTIFLGNNALLTELKVNATNSRSLTFAGVIHSDGRCAGTTFSDPYGTWENVVVQASVKIMLRNFQVPVSFSTNELTLPSGVRCRANQKECTDFDGTTTYWTTFQTDHCKFNQYDVLYEGMAHRLTPRPEQENDLTIYTVTTQDTTFALAKTSESNLCGYLLIHTEHPKLYVLETQKGRGFNAKSKSSVDNMDLFAYVNSKFVYVEKHLRTQLTKLYQDIMTQKCALERQILENALSLSSIAPDEMAYRLMKSPGYTAVTAGEVIYIIKCVPVSCKIRQTDECYNELPVTHKNTSYFLAPRSRILTRTGTPRDCNELLPVMYRIQDIWYRLTPRPVESLPPPVIKPLTKPTWKYTSPAYLATSGIYSTEDLNRLRNHIMFPVEKPSMLNTLAQEAMGREIPPGSISLFNMMDEKSLEKIAQSAGSRIWQGFITFGSASAGVLAIVLLFRLIKLVIDSLIRGYALHSIYGWSLHLLGAIWSSITHLLLHLNNQRKDELKKQPDAKALTQEEQPLTQPQDEKTQSNLQGSNTPPLQSEVTTKDIAPRDYGDLNKYLRTLDP